MFVLKESYVRLALISVELVLDSAMGQGWARLATRQVPETLYESFCLPKEKRKGVMERDWWGRKETKAAGIERKTIK